MSKNRNIEPPYCPACGPDSDIKLIILWSVKFSIMPRDNKAPATENLEQIKKTTVMNKMRRAQLLSRVCHVLNKILWS